MNPVIDTTFGINQQALVLLQALVGMEYQIAEDVVWDEPRFHTSVLYNGRERGIVLTVESSVVDPNPLNIFFGENRGSDNIFVQIANFKRGINPPTFEDFGDLSYETRKEFPYMAIDKAATYVQKLVVKYLNGKLRKAA